MIMSICTSFNLLKDNPSKKKRFFLVCVSKFLHTSPLKKDRKSSTYLSVIKNNSHLCKQKEKDGHNIDKIVSPEKREKSLFVQHVFKWGIGNKFRSDPENRFHPVHLNRSKEVTIRKSYFDSDNENIKYEELNEQWEVFWFQNNKLNAKPFPIKKYGIEAAKKEAIKFYETLKVNNYLNTKPQFESGVEGVHYDVVTNCWVSFYRLNNFPVSRSFSAEYHGFETAKKLAIERVNKYQK
ncbi:AP2 domain transcription factor [Plasmodium brasilianum]|uniref:Transcription factor with AP2 domain(S), putative n=2 Tax=Plasmodium (Plasmodium) TaxID=418103 RepID=A0A1A8WVL6_PLAMA|nr:transcription factor with AP2 domain(s), putative [Plasmodium malariae]KAI4838281.1 AP2 domain transcription factor [Plasmodium brasilianum]SBS96388.1 transcription factor with AP2 domain(s), putative (ApiAP2) [Plasmodium malariae]SCN12676.1 transcription factor with AP2 domain(s), putative [Plasmodium malariae]